MLQGRYRYACGRCNYEQLLTELVVLIVLNPEDLVLGFRGIRTALPCKKNTKMGQVRSAMNQQLCS